jgi:hypothetical protein
MPERGGIKRCAAHRYPVRCAQQLGRLARKSETARAARFARQLFEHADERVMFRKPLRFSQ